MDSTFAVGRLGPVIAVAFLLVMLCPAIDTSRPAHASTCRYLEFVFSEEALKEAADWAELVIIGEVTSSWPIPGTPDSSSAVVHAKAYLKGHLPSNELTLIGLSLDDCSAGPPLHEGELVLLVVARVGPSQQYYVPPFVGKTVFESGGAFTEPLFGERQYLGDPETAVRRWAAAAGASEDATNRAVMAVTGEASRPTTDARWGWLAGTTVVALLTILLFSRRFARS